MVEVTDKHCVSCGVEIAGRHKENKGVWSRKKAAVWIIVSVLLTSIVVTFFWVLVVLDNKTRSDTQLQQSNDEAANVISHLLETIGRQSTAMSDAEQITRVMTVAISSDCIFSPDCVDKAVSDMTSLRTKVDSEKQEIDNQWSETGIGGDLDSYFYQLNTRQQTKIIDVMKIYFPDEVKDLKTDGSLL